VSEYLGSGGTIAAHFEYDPFGNTTVNTDTGNQFAYRFSTKPADTETGLYYYGYRYYDPMTGRWPSRDPIWERGGLNLYGFIGNNSIGKLDVVGLIDFLNPWPPSAHGNCGQKDADVQALIDSLKALEAVKGKKDGKSCYKIKIYRNVTDRNESLRGINGSCDIVYQVAHGGIDPQNAEERRSYPSQFRSSPTDVKNSIPTGVYESHAESLGKEYCPYGCFINPNKDSDASGVSVFNALKKSIDDRVKSAPDCCPNVKTVCLYFGRDDKENAGPTPPYPPDWAK
jgi:RHS repeat-associated protein